jgi:hypothetical protein
MAPALLALLPLVAQLAPGLIRDLAGDRAGDVAQRVTAAVRAVVGGDHPDQLQAAMLDPAKAADLRLELARIEAEERAAERADDMQRLTASLADIASARAQTVELARAGSAIAWGAPIVSAVVLIAFAAAAWLVLTRALPAGSQDVALYTMGSLQTLAAAVVAYWVGSSAGSARKDQAMQGLLRGPFDPAAEARR